MPSLHFTLELAQRMHKDVDDWTGVPYIVHPISVMLLLPSSCCEDDKHLALLHDTIEDCADLLCQEFAISPDGLSKTEILEQIFCGFRTHYSTYVVDGLRLLTRDVWPDLGYLQYVQNIVHSGHRGAMWVKWADNMDNTNSLRCSRLSDDLKQKAAHMGKRYQKSLEILNSALQENDNAG